MSIEERLQKITLSGYDVDVHWSARTEYPAINTIDLKPNAIAQIIKAFEDDHWIRLRKNQEWTMTGQEWYDRFVSEWLSINTATTKSIDILEAAKRASEL